MMKFNFKENQIEFKLETENKEIIPFNNWMKYIENISYINIVNDLIVNGIILLNDDGISLSYENISKLDSYEYSILKLPPPYPYDLFVDIIGSGLKDKNLKLKYSFQDFAHGNGSGNILFNKGQLTGAYLNGDSEYLLTSNQFLLIKEIENINHTSFYSSNDVLKSIAKLQLLSVEARAVLSKILIDTEIILPEKIKINIEKIGEDKYKLIPIIDHVDQEKFEKRFKLLSRVKPEYSYKNKIENKKVRILIDSAKNESDNSIHTELKKLKETRILSTDDINDIYDSPTKFWDADLIDLDDFSERVIELGIYKPKFYPFISPYKSEWIPGFVIDDKINGKRLVKISNEEELSDIKSILKKSENKGENNSIIKGEEVDNVSLKRIIENAEKQLSDPKNPITTSIKEDEKTKSETKVLIIKENTEDLDFIRDTNHIKDVKYKFQKIENLDKKIKLKKHQKEGVAWLQTLFEPPHNAPGVLLADDMGLGKTLQVMYFFEWYIQKGFDKPILIVAPVSLLENWENEYGKFFPNPSLSVETLWGPNVKNFIIPSDKKVTKERLNKKAIFLTTYETLRKQQIPLAMIQWGIIILDEAQKVKTPGTLVTNAAKAMKTDFKIAMTGTPVENSLMDLWCIIDFCSPGLLESARSFSKKYQRPLKNKNTDMVELSSNLRQEIGSSLMRRMKTDVAKDLPNIEYITHKDVMSEKQYQIYLNEIAIINQIKKEKRKGSQVLQSILNLKRISDHPYLKHYRLEIIPSEELLSLSAKLKRTILLLKDIEKLEEKAILFTENKSMQRVLRRIIHEVFNINPVIINGETPSGKSKGKKVKLSRQQEIDKYQEKEGFNVIIMSPIAAGFGLNITEANHVIHYTRHWNPAKEQQATDRAYRIGQKRDVKVHYPMAVAPENKIKTFDLILDELLSRKSNLASNTLFPTEQIEINKSDFLNSLDGSEESDEIIINDITDLDMLNPLMFEAAIALLLEKKYNGISKLTPISNDKGADILFFNDTKNLLIQVKQSINSLGIASGQEIIYALPEYKKMYNNDFNPQVITNNYYNVNAVESANHNNVELINRDQVKNWIKDHPLDLDEIEKKLDDRIKL